MTRIRVGQIVSIDYPAIDPEPDGYYPGEYIGMVVKSVEGRIKVVFAYEGEPPDFSWFTPHGKKWIDKTYGAIVRIEDGTSEQEKAFWQHIPKKQLRELSK